MNIASVLIKLYGNCEVLRLASLKPELQKQPSSFPVSFAVALLGTCIATSQELNPVQVLHGISGSYEPLSLWGTQAATRLPQVVLLLFVHSCLAYLLLLGVTMQTSDRNLSPLLTLLDLVSVLPLL